MSLINDALRRAKEAQRQAPPPPSPQMQFRPVEPAQHPPPGRSLFVPVALTVVTLVALVFVWQWSQGRASLEPREVRALTSPAAQATIAPQTAAPSPAVVAVPAEPSPPSQPPFLPDSATGVVNPPAVTTSTAPPKPPVAREQDNVVVNSEVIAPPPPKPPPLKLQAIVFNPKRPSVVINGRTLFVGEKMGDARVVAIDQESATLVAAGWTNILTMPE